MVTCNSNSARTEVRPAEQNGISIGLGVFATTDIKKSADIVVLDQPPIALVEESNRKMFALVVMMWAKAGVLIIGDPGWSRLVCGVRLFLTAIRYSSSFVRIMMSQD